MAVLLTPIYYAAISFTGHFEFRPNTIAARLLGLSWAFWALIVASAYTANLASFLVTPRVYSYRISNIEDAIEQDATLCVQDGAVIHTILAEKYPSLKFAGKGSEQEIFEGPRLPVGKGGCQAAAHQYNTYSVYKRNKEVNFDCALSSEERIVEIIPAGMATAIDTGFPYCTSLVGHVLDYHLNEMKVRL